MKKEYLKNYIIEKRISSIASGLLYSAIILLFIGLSLGMLGKVTVSLSIFSVTFVLAGAYFYSEWRSGNLPKMWFLISSFAAGTCLLLLILSLFGVVQFTWIDYQQIHK